MSSYSATPSSDVNVSPFLPGPHMTSGAMPNPSATDPRQASAMNAGTSHPSSVYSSAMYPTADSSVMDSNAKDFNQHPQTAPIQSDQEQGLNLAVENLRVAPGSPFSAPFQPEHQRPKLIDDCSMQYDDLSLHSTTSQAVTHAHQHFQSPNLIPNLNPGQNPVDESGPTFEFFSTLQTAGNIQSPNLNPSNESH